MATARRARAVQTVAVKEGFRSLDRQPFTFISSVLLTGRFARFAAIRLFLLTGSAASVAEPCDFAVLRTSGAVGKNASQHKDA